MKDAFNELDLWCTDLDFSISLQVRQSELGELYVDCPLPRDRIAGEISVYSNALAMFIE
jgi:hypothetical protein